MTDVTGFGLLGHLLEICRGSQLGAKLYGSQVPILNAAQTHAAAGIFPGAARRNWESYATQVSLANSTWADWQVQLLADPQTSGGLIVVIAPEATAEVLKQIQEAGYIQADVIGECVEGAVGVELLTN
jgi:selenide,water dikinase